MGSRIRELPPIPESDEYRALEAAIVALFRSEIYLPIMAELGADKGDLHNSRDDLLRAITTGRIHYINGHFEGKYDADISRELKRLGATWSRSSQRFSLPLDALTSDMRVAIGRSASQWRRIADNVDEHLAKIEAGKISDKLKLDGLFDKTIYRFNKGFEASVKAVSIAPTFSVDEAARIRREYVDTTLLDIDQFARAQISELRKQVSQATVQGYRREGMVAFIQHSYGVSENKAKFLARQETSLLTSKIKQVRYEAAGLPEYRWRCVAGSPLHPVRPMHQALNGLIFRWDTPPVVNEKGDRKHPGCDYNCRCTARAIVRF